MEPFLENTNYSQGLVNTTINMAEMDVYNTTRSIGVTKYCSFNHPRELEMESNRQKFLEFIENIKDF